MVIKVKRWTTSNKAIFNLGYHIIFCTKYRRKVLSELIQLRLKELLLNKAGELDICIENMEIMSNHVHLFIKSNPVDSPHFIVQQLKGYTSSFLRKEFKELKSKLPSLWTRSYYVESVGCISEDTVKKYIDNQKNK